MTRSHITKHPADRVWAGVCAGIAGWLGVDPVLIRLAWLAWAVFGDTGSAFVVYIVLMIILPVGETGTRGIGGRRRRGFGRPGGPWTASLREPAPPAPLVPPVPPTVAVPPADPAPLRAAASSPAPARSVQPTSSTASMSSTAPVARAPSPTADELGDVVLRLLDATVDVSVSVARSFARAVQAGFASSAAADRVRMTPPPAPAPPSSAPADPNVPTARSDELPHLESDEERLHRELRARLDRQVGDARKAVHASQGAVATGERVRRRGRLRQLAGFGVLSFGVWGLAATLDVHPIAFAGASLPSMSSAAVVMAAVLVGLGTYLLWTAVRGHG
ncbi:MAG: PspC domain-containing protein [Ardenticatenales bacterium]